jgi:hypothetical protein
VEEPHPVSAQAIVFRSLGELFREASVLVGVFASLEPALKGSRFGVSWVLTVVIVTILLFLLGLYFTVMGDRTS